MTTPPGGSYPGPDPEDPFAKPPNESSSTPPPPAPTEETAPIQREELGYWEKQAQESAQQQAATQHPADPGYQQNPTTAQFPSDPSQPETENPWAGYGVPATPSSAVPPPPNPYGGVQPPYYGGVPAVQPSHPQSTTVLVLGLIGLIGGCLCGLPWLVSPFAWVMGARVKREIRASNGQLGGEGNANAGFVMGIIGTVLLVLAILFFVVIVVVAVATDGTTTTTSTNF